MFWGGGGNSDRDGDPVTGAGREATVETRGPADRPLSASAIRSPYARIALIGLAYCLAYVALDWVSDLFAWSNLEFTLWNPQSALTPALVAAFGAGYALFAFPATLIADYASGAEVVNAASMLSSLVLAGGYAALGVAVRRFRAVDLWLGDMRQASGLLLFLALGILAISILVVMTYVAAGDVAPSAIPLRVAELWVGDVTGALALLPLLLLVASDPSRWLRQFRRAAVDVAIFLAGLSVVAVIVFADFADELQFFYLLFVPIIWLAVRHGIFGGTLAVFLSQLGIVMAVLLHGYQKEAFLSFQMLTLILGATGLLLGSAVTARETAQQQLRKHQTEMDRISQVTAIGTMGSALAHEISQPLASIFTYVRACQLFLGKGPDGTARLSETLAKIGAETERAGDILRNMRSLLAEGSAAREPLDLRALTMRALDIVQREPSAASVTIEEHIGDVPRISADPRHVEQVVLNIVRNAVEATASATPGGLVRISAAVRGGFVEIAIDDNGGGIPPELLTTLFDAFVTTKPLGLGLGLPISRNLVELYGGEIVVTNHANGARFVIRLPVEEK